MGTILAHETWFTSARPPFDWSFTFQAATLALIIAAVAVAAFWRVVGRHMPKPEIGLLRPLGRLSPWIPRLLGVHAGVSLLAQAVKGTYLAPSLELPDGGFGTALAIIEGLAGVWLISGFRLRPAAVLLVAAGPLGMLRYGVVPVLERVDLLGVALFLAILPPGEDEGGAVYPSPRRLTYALLALRSLVGLALVVLAFTEKLARPELAEAFLTRFPAFNVLHSIDFSDVAFIRLAGAVELLFGLLIVSGAMPQLAVIVAGIPFNATLFFLGASELIGHLPIYGAMLALLVYGSDPQAAQLVPSFRAPSPMGLPFAHDRRSG
jgi:hypothetical protein